MTDLQTTFSGYATLLAQYIYSAKKYITNIREFVAKIDPIYYNTIATSLDTIGKKLEEFKVMTVTITPGKIIDELELFYNIYDLIDLINIETAAIDQFVGVDKYFTLTSRNISASASRDIFQERKQAAATYQKYKNYDVAATADIFSKLFIGLTETDNKKLFDFCMINKLNKFVIEAIRYLYNLPSDITNINKNLLKTIIEKEKDAIFSAKRIKLPYPGSQELVIRSNLTPLTISLTLEKIFGLANLDWDSAVTFDKNLQAAANTSMARVILINKNSKSPIEYNIRGLISAKYIKTNDLQTEPTEGLSKKVIMKYDTIRELKTSIDPSPHQLRIYHPAGINKIPPKSLVLETLNGDLYRILSTDNENIFINSADFRVDGLNMRQYEYNMIHQERILAKCFDPKFYIIINAYKEAKAAQIAEIGIKLKSDFANYFDSIITTETKYEDMIEHLLNKGQITKILLGRLLASITQKSDPEYQISYITKFDDLIKTFIRNFEVDFKKQGIGPKLYKERAGEDLYRFLKTAYDSAIAKTIMDLDANKRWSDIDVSLKEFYLDYKYLS